MDKVIFITGATSGFGLATARLFASKSWKIVATGRRAERLEALKAELGADRVHTAIVDLMDARAIHDAVAALPETFKPIMCLFNNGGLALGTKPWPDIALEDWRVMVETNIMGLLHTTHEVLPLLKQAGKGASIVNVSSIAARFAYPGGNVYGASKAFVRQMSYELRCDLEETDIRVTSLEPGMAKSEFTLVRTKGNAEANENLYKGVDPILPEDIAEMVWFIANQPPHVNINSLEVMAQKQVPAMPKIIRDPDA